MSIPPLPKRERHRIVTTTHLRRRIEVLRNKAGDLGPQNIGDPQSIVWKTMADEYEELARSVDDGGEPRVSIQGDEEANGDSH